MSLRAIHVIVIVLSIALLFFFGFWSIANYQNLKETLYLVMGSVSLLLGILLLPYVAWFIIKTKRPVVS